MYAICNHMAIVNTGARTRIYLAQKPIYMKVDALEEVYETMLALVLS